MSDLRRAQLMLVRSDLDTGFVYPPIDGNEFWIDLLGSNGIRAIAKDARKRIKACVDKLPPLPDPPVEVPLSEAGQAYWDAVKNRPVAPRAESGAESQSENKPHLGAYKPHKKLVSPVQKRHRAWSDKIADLVHIFDDLPDEVKTEFAFGMHVGNFVLPIPKYIKEKEGYDELVSDRRAIERVIEVEEVKAAYIAGVERSLNRETSLYPMSGRITVERANEAEKK